MYLCAYVMTACVRTVMILTELRVQVMRAPTNAVMQKSNRQPGLDPLLPLVLVLRLNLPG